MRWVFISIAGIFLVAASPVEEGNRLIDQGKGKDGLALVEKAAAAGDAEALDYLGLLYDEGKVVGQDLVRAASLYRRAAEAGNSHAQWRLGVMLDMSEGVAENPDEAVKWFKRAAAQGDRSATVSLAVMYAMGRGLAQDFAESMKLYRAAARQGEPHGFYGVGILHARGEGVPENRAEAFAWMLVASTLGDRQAKELIEKEAFIKQDGQKAAKRATEILKEFGHHDKQMNFRDLDAEKLLPQRPK